MAYSLENVASLGHPNREFFRKIGGLIEIASVYEDSDKTLVIDFSGPIKKITLGGTFTGTKSEIKVFTAELDAILDGTQDDTSTYTSDVLTSTIEVKLSAFDWEYIAGDPAFIRYTLTLTESDPEE